ncbi:MAG: hypothetical protein OHK0029_13340 [Armatimonadaceae bacterium]
MNNPLNQFTEEVYTNLKHLSEEERRAEVTEIRAHLEALIQQKKAEGLSEETAAAEAIRQFGSVRALNQGLHRAHRRAQWKRFLSFWWGRDSIPVATFVLFALCLGGIAMWGYLWKQIMHLPPLNGWTYALCLSVFLCFVMGFAGATAARIAPRTVLYGLIPCVGFILSRIVPEYQKMRGDGFSFFNITPPFFVVHGFLFGLAFMVVAALLVRKRCLLDHRASP